MADIRLGRGRLYRIDDDGTKHYLGDVEHFDPRRSTDAPRPPPAPPVFTFRASLRVSSLYLEWLNMTGEP